MSHALATTQLPTAAARWMRAGSQAGRARSTGNGMQRCAPRAYDRLTAVSVRRKRFVAAERMCLDEPSGLVVHPLDVCLELGALDTPLPPAADLDGGQRAAADQGVRL